MVDQNQHHNANHRDLLADYLTREFGPLPQSEEIGNSSFPLTFRLMTQDDVDQKAWVHSRTWRETYDGMLPRPIVQLVSPDFAKNVTLRHGTDGYAHTMLVFAGPRVIGFSEWLDTPRPPYKDPDPHAPTAVEIGSIYLLRAYQHRGIGTKLMDATIAAAGSPKRVMLWVVDKNSPAQKFYSHYGFRPTGQIQEEDNGQTVEQAWLRE